MAFASKVTRRPMMDNSNTSFAAGVRHRLVEQFAVGYYNASIKPNFAEKNPMTGKEIEYLMDGPQFEKIPKQDIWSYATAVGSGYQYRVVYRDKRFSDVDKLLGMYSGAIPVSDEEKPVVEERLYQIILVMIKEGRLPKTFRLQSGKEAEEQRVVTMVEEFGRSLEELGLRVRKLEEQLAAQKESRDQVVTLPLPPSETPSDATLG